MSPAGYCLLIVLGVILLWLGVAWVLSTLAGLA